MSSVIPRVIPIFIRELTAASTRALRDEHIRQLIANLSDVFNSRVLDDDVVDLVSCLISMMRDEFEENVGQLRAKQNRIAAAALGGNEHVSSERSDNLRRRPTIESAEESNILLTVVTETTSFHILRLLLHMFDLNAVHAPRCFRAMKKFSDALSRKRAIKAEMEAKSEAIEAAKTNAAGERDPSNQSRQQQYQKPPTTSTSLTTTKSAASAKRIAHSLDDVLENPALLHMDGLLENDSTRRMLIRLWKEWDGSGVEIDHFTSEPEKLHLYLSQRNSSSMRVFRDFCFCTPRPKLATQWGSTAACHIKTNIPKKSDIMYRILVEGYNYGVNAVVFSDVVGYTNRNWETVTDLEQYGWPKGWDAEMANDYAPGAAISQYYSSDGFLVVRLRAKSMFCIGFGVSAWMVFNGFGAGFPITGTIYHQDEDL